MAVADDDQPLVEMGTMGCEHVLAVAQASQEGERGVEDERPNRQHPKDRAGGGDGTRLSQAEKRNDGERIAEECASHVAHEDPRRRPIVQEEPKARGRQEERQTRDQGTTGHPSQAGPAHCGDHGLCAGQPVAAVHKVVGIGQPDDPKPRQHGSRGPQRCSVAGQERKRLPVSQRETAIRALKPWTASRSAAESE